MKLKVPFKHMRVLLLEKEVEFSFTLPALCVATEEVLKCELWEIGEKPNYDINVAILFGAYIQACREVYKKPKYDFIHGAFWFEHMSKESREIFVKACTDLLGKINHGREVKEQKKK